MEKCLQVEITAIDTDHVFVELAEGQTPESIVDRIRRQGGYRAVWSCYARFIPMSAITLIEVRPYQPRTPRKKK